MAKIRVKQGNNEIEIDSRDFYVDNDTAEEVIERLKQLISDKSGNSVMDSLEDAEFHEPEFSEPVNVTISDIKNKLRILAKNSFFAKPRTVGEAASHLPEYRRSPSPLDVSVALTKMAFNKEVLKNTQEDRNFYFSKEALLTN